jgi:hypothetical protein
MARRQVYEVYDAFDYNDQPFGGRRERPVNFAVQRGQLERQDIPERQDAPRDVATRCYGVVQAWDPGSGVGRIRELGTMEYLSASKAVLDRSGGVDKLPVYFYNRSVRRMDVYAGQMVEYMRILEKSGFVAHDALPLHNFKVAFGIDRPFANRPNYLHVSANPHERDTIDARRDVRRDVRHVLRDDHHDSRREDSRPNLVRHVCLRQEGHASRYPPPKEHDTQQHDTQDVQSNAQSEVQRKVDTIHDSEKGEPRQEANNQSDQSDESDNDSQDVRKEKKRKPVQRDFESKRIKFRRSSS